MVITFDRRGLLVLAVALVVFGAIYPSLWFPAELRLSGVLKIARKACKPFVYDDASKAWLNEALKRIEED